MTDDFIDKLEEAFPNTSIVKSEEIIEGKIVEIIPYDLDVLNETYRRMRKFVGKNMNRGEDYGVIPGTNKPTLYKPGAEKLQRLFSFSTETVIADPPIEQWDVPVTETTFPLFHYRYITRVYNHNGIMLASCEGECNSYETKYRWRKVPKHAVPKDYNLDLLEKVEGKESEFVFAVDKAETTGDYGKPAEYWEEWKQDIANNRAVQIQRKTRSGSMLPAWERGGTVYRIPNDDIHNQINTIMKISQKRSYVGAILIASNGSNFFTQDLEDILKEAQEDVSIYMLVPEKDSAARQLMAYIKTLGITEPGEWVKKLLEENNLVWSLDNWTPILDLAHKELKIEET